MKPTGMVRVALALVLTLGACGPRPPRNPGAGGPTRRVPEAPPPLVVLVVIDQLPAWAFEARRPLLQGGIARLLARGRYYADAEYPYSSTYTAPGHAALGTGAPPAVTGIIGNEWWRREQGASVESVTDPASPLLDVAGGAPRDKGAASPRALRVGGVGDALLAQRPGARVVGVSLKDRGAILPVGQHPTLAVWYDPAQAAFTTSTWYARALPPWLATLAREHPVAPRLEGYVWQARDPALYQRVLGDDAQPGEPPAAASFPHPLSASANPAKAVRATPLGNALLVEAALAAVAGEGLGRDAVPDLLTVSFSGHDLVGHAYGQESWETLDMLLDTDARIAELLDGLDAAVGKQRYAVVLSSDHGVTRMVERTLAAGRPAGRITTDALEQACEQVATTLLGPSPDPAGWIAATRDPYVYLAAAASKLERVKHQTLLRALSATLLATGTLGHVRPVASVAGGCDRRSGDEQRMCWSVDPEQSGDLLYGARPDFVVQDPDLDVTVHGTLNPDDRTVPVIVRGPGFSPGRTDTRVSTLSVAATLAHLLGITPGPAVTAPTLR
ncbi:MAG: alkaline phosphatase family protein [Deltaproteobacteria bacterium]|nr:alkaline phosphatase family protein [Deltaproteobacteria bacterium]